MTDKPPPAVLQAPPPIKETHPKTEAVLRKPPPIVEQQAVAVLQIPNVVE
jgi:hypothetical protein